MKRALLKLPHRALELGQWEWLRFPCKSCLLFLFLHLFDPIFDNQVVSLLQDSKCSTEKGKSEAALQWRAASFVAEIGGHIRIGRGKDGALGLRQLDAVAGNWLSPLCRRAVSH